MLTTEYDQKKSDIRKKIKEEEARWRNVPGERPNAHRRIQTPEDGLEKLELQYAQQLEKKSGT
jgi:hypothetical protein